MSIKENKFVPRVTNYRSEVYDLIQGECILRRNGGKGFSLTVNQIILDYFAGKNVVKIETLPGPEGAQAVPVVYVAEEPSAKCEAQSAECRAQED